MEQLAQILRLLGDETRLRILVLLSKHPLNVSELTSILGVAQSGVSRHLGHLRKLGLIQEQKAGVWTYYQLSGPCLLYTSPSPRDCKTSRMPSSA